MPGVVQTEPEGFVTSRSDIINCSFSSWYPIFKKHSPKARIIKPLPESFLQYLHEDGIILPTSERPANTAEFSDSDLEDVDDEISTADGSVKRSDTRADDFPEVVEEIKQVLEEWGPVAPKLNWSSPKDATWISYSNSMKCYNVGDILMLLKSSSYIVYDLQNVFEPVNYSSTETADQSGDSSSTAKESTDKPEYELVLRKWFDIVPSLEFRCFVKSKRLIAISQRDLNYYEFLIPLQEQLSNVIEDFFTETIKPKFPNSDYVVDVYVPRPFTNVWIIDFNPFVKNTDPLLFTWSELFNISTNHDVDEPVFKLVKHTDVGRFASKEHSENHVPQDIVHASLTPDGISELTRSWNAILARQEQESDSDSEVESN